MGNIGDLNFQVILGGESEFRTKINKFKDMAEELNTSLSDALDFSKKIKTEPIKTVSKALNDAGKSATSAATSQGKYSSALDLTNNKLKTSKDLLGTISKLTGVAFSVVGIRQFFSSLVDITGEFEVQKMALTSMLQDADKADEIFGTLRQEALKSPYTFQDLTKYAKQLIAFNIDADKLVETERRLADVASGVGVDVGRIILAYGQVKAAGVLKGTELRQFTEAGVPLLQSLAEQIKETEGNAISLAEVFQRISKKQIPFEMVEEAFRRMTDEGGKFYNMQEVLVNTLQGKVRKLKDTWQQSLYDMGQSTDSWLKNGVDAATFLAANLDKIGFALKPIIAGFGAYAAILAIVWIREKAIIALNIAKVLLRVATGANTAAAAMRLFGISSASAAGAIGLVVAAGVALVGIISSINGPLERFEKQLDKIHQTAHDTSSYDAEIGRLNHLKKTLNDANSSYDERKRALAEIKSIVPAYHADLTTEGRLINNNKTALDNYIESLKREAKVKAYQDELTELYKKQAKAEEERDDAQEAVDKYNEKRNDYTTMPAMVPGITNGRSPQFVEGQILDNQLTIAQGKVDLVKERIEKINKKLNAIDFPLPKNPTWGPNNPAGNSEIQKITDQIAILEKYADMREKLMPYFGSKTDEKMAEIFGKDRDYSHLNEEILALCDALRKLGDEGVRAAEQVETRMGLDKGSAILKAAKAMEDWQKTLRKWKKDWGSGDYSGIEYDIEGVVRGYNDELQTISDEFLDAEKKAIEAHRGNAEAMQQELDVLFRLNEARKVAAKNAAQEKLNDLASKYVRDKTKHLNARDWGDKSIGQVRDIYRTLTELAAGGVVIDEALGKELKEAGLKIEDFSLLTREEFEKLSDEAKEEYAKKIAEAIQGITNSLMGAAGAMKDWAEATGNSGLASVMEGIMAIGPVISNAAQSLLKGDVIGAVVGAVTSLVTGLFEAATAAAKFENALAAVREEARRSGMSDTLKSGVDNVFGPNDLAKVRNANKVFEEIQKNKNKLGATPNIRYKKGFWDYVTFGLAHHNGSIAELAQQMGMDLYDAYGNLNAEMLQKILDTYKGLGKEEKDWIQAAINDSEAYAEAMEQLQGVVESVYGDVASSATDKIVESWKERRDAALDYADVLDDVATKYAKMMIESAMLDTVLDDKKAKELVNMFAQGQTEAAMETIANDMATIQAMAPVWEQILETFDPYFNRTSTGESATLKDGINKELVEGNSSLIASYMNAMRADLSVIRMYQSAGWQDVRLIRESTPSLVEYTAQIAANTFDSAQASNAILSKLQSIITPSTNGGSAVRTTK